MTAPRRRAECMPAKVLFFDARFADGLRFRRVELGLSRRELEERTGIAARSIEKIERPVNGHRRPVTIGEAIVLAEALDIQPAALLKGAAR